MMKLGLPFSPGPSNAPHGTERGMRKMTLWKRLGALGVLIAAFGLVWLDWMVFGLMMCAGLIHRATGGGCYWIGDGGSERSGKHWSRVFDRRCKTCGADVPVDVDTDTDTNTEIGADCDKYMSSASSSLPVYGDTAGDGGIEGDTGYEEQSEARGDIGDLESLGASQCTRQSCFPGRMQTLSERFLHGPASRETIHGGGSQH